MMNLLQPMQGFRSKQRVRSALDHVRRAARVGNYWYWLEPPELREGIDIGSLISPLRYDVLVRRDFFSFYAEHRDLYRSDFETFLRLAKAGPYYTWFTASEVIRCRLRIRGNPEAVEAAFVDRVRDAASLYENVMACGLEPRYPIILKTAETLRSPTADRTAGPTGKKVSGQYFLADGCHRLALMMSIGHTRLPAECYRVKCYREFSPFDSTSLLARALPIEPDKYFAFLSMRYCAPERFVEGADLMRFIREQRPQYVSEVLSIIRVDGFGKYLAQPGEI
jgi:hypothetical protein